MDEIPSSINHIDQEFDDNAGEELDLRRDKNERDVITCGVEPSLLAVLEAISRERSGKSHEKAG